MKPDLSKLSINQLEELTGRSHRFVKRRLSAAGVEPVGKDGRSRFYPAPAALAAVFVGEDGERLDATQERARLDRARAERAELDLARARAELVPGDQIEGPLVAVLQGVRAHILATPSKVGARFGQECADYVEGLLHEALHEIADGKIDLEAQR